MLTIDQKLLLLKKSYDGIMAQGRRSHYDGVCAYRTPEGLKCGIGHLIADDVYDESFERKSACYLVIMIAVEKSQNIPLDKQLFQDSTYLTNSADAKFLIALQQAHDTAAEKTNSQAFLEQFKCEIELVEARIKKGYWA